MRSPQLRLNFGNELIVDNFAGGGGASLGIEQAFGRAVDIAINHDPEALAMHKANHPETRHYCEDVFEIDPEEVTKGRQVGLAWFSPDCTYHSKARGGKPFRDKDKAKRRRGLAWVVVKWARTVHPRVLMLENVEEFQYWGPLLADGTPCPERRGLTYRRWKKQLENAGYKVEDKELRGCDYGAPTIRKRLFIIARCDGLPIRWPKPTHGEGRNLLPYRTAAECIDWSHPCPSIFERKKPLAEATQRRIAKGIQRFVVEAAEPFIIPVTHGGDTRVHSINEPVRTITTAHRGELALTVPHLVGAGGPSYSGKPAPIDKPFGVVTGDNHRALVAPYIVPRYGERPTQDPRTYPIYRPLPTITPDANCGYLVTPFLTKFRAESAGADIAKPAPTITANSFLKRPGGCAPIGLVAPVIVKQNFGEKPCHSVKEPLHTITTQHNKHALVAAFLAKHYGGNETPGWPLFKPISTLTTQDHHHVVTSHLLKFRGTCQHGQDARDPLHTITGQGYHFAEVRAFLLKYYGTAVGQSADDPLHTITAKARMGLVTVKGEDYIIADICMRMLKPRELYRAQGFTDNYIINPIVNGKPLSQGAQVRMVGNSVCPPIARALVEANFRHEAKYAEDVA
jgi:DNA (cytosine-5)-methyltransferase 1